LPIFNKFKREVDKLIDNIIEKTTNSLKNLDIYIDNTEVDFILENNIDSITFIHIILNIEEEFSIIIPDEYLLMENLNTISKIADLVQELC